MINSIGSPLKDKGLPFWATNFDRVSEFTYVHYSKVI